MDHSLWLGIFPGIFGQNSTFIFFLENWYTYVKKHALSKFGSTETLAPVITGKITKNRKFYDKNGVTFCLKGPRLSFFFRKWNFRHFYISSQKTRLRNFAEHLQNRAWKILVSKKLVSCGKIIDTNSYVWNTFFP